jgi:4,5-DOPA dioxygenase extradiol
MQLQEIYTATKLFDETATMPLLFVGHGNPMNAIEETEFTKGWRKAATDIPKPNAIICVSAHWQTQGTFLTAMEKPKTIHDFYGFPKELFDVEYPAPGSPALAEETKKIIKKTSAELDETWGLDHGCWSVVKQMYPNADVPVIQLSLDYTKSPQWHYELAKDLAALRKKGILIIGSGNIVHNLGMLDWNSPNNGFDWAEEANEKVKDLVLNNEHQQLENYNSISRGMQLSVPTPEHFLPLLYVLGLKEKNEQVSFFNDKTVYGSISMTSLLINKS